MIRTLPALLLTILLALAPAPAAAKDPAGESDEARFVRLTRHLEAQPLSDADKSIRTWLLTWASDHPDLVVVVCDILGPIPVEQHPWNGYLLTQSVFGNAAFQIEHPDRREDLVAVQLAGIESALATYGVLVAAQPDQRIPYFDTLADHQRAGSLRGHMAPLITKECSG